VALWCFICFFISILGVLALAFPAILRAGRVPYAKKRRPPGPFFYGVKMRFRVNYGNVIRLDSNEDALDISILFLFRMRSIPRFAFLGRKSKMAETEVSVVATRVSHAGSIEERILRDAHAGIFRAYGAQLGIMARIPNASNLQLIIPDGVDDISP